MQAVETERIKQDDGTWRVKCANPTCGIWFTATRYDASYHSGSCRKQASTEARRKQAAIAEMSRMARRTSAIAADFNGSQDVYEQMTALHKAIGKQLGRFAIYWKPQELPLGEGS